MDPIKQAQRSNDISTKVAQLFKRRAEIAQEHYRDRMTRAWNDHVADVMTDPKSPWELWTQGYNYAVDFAQRSILFWDTLRQRGNNYREHKRRGQPPLLHFDYEIVLDGRKFERPVNYALVRILPPKGVTVDAKRRPYVIIDPRAGHGPGIGGFKDDSQVGVALREGHPVYFVIFFREPEPGQTLLDVCAAEQQFVHRVRELHPHSPKPAIVGNCQGGWAAMMVAASSPDDTGPIVINGAPMSYWGGAWAEGEGDNPMRYAGGMLGGTWLASFTADLGAGIFDGAYLVENFENLNPANTFWDKYYNLYANVDTEAPRFLEFERWWGGFFLMNREEIEWITRNLFVGNKLWKGGTAAGHGQRLRPARHQDADHPVRVDGRQHHAAAAGVQLGRRRLRLDRRDQGARPGDRRPAARECRPPRHLRVRQGREEGACADRLGAEVGRGAAAGPVRHGHPRAQEGRRRRSSTTSSSASGGWRRSRPASTASSARTKSRSRPSPSCPNSIRRRTNCSRSRWCNRWRARPRPRSRANSIRCASSAGRSPASIPGSRGCRPRRMRSRPSASRWRRTIRHARSSGTLRKRSVRRSIIIVKCATR